MPGRSRAWESADAQRRVSLDLGNLTRLTALPDGGLADARPGAHRLLPTRKSTLSASDSCREERFRRTRGTTGASVRILDRIRSGKREVLVGFRSFTRRRSPQGEVIRILLMTPRPERGRPAPRKTGPHTHWDPVKRMNLKCDSGAGKDDSQGLRVHASGRDASLCSSIHSLETQLLGAFAGAVTAGA
jgi:hypothetical protein